MKITPKIFHFPPYLSTSWESIVAIHKEKNDELSLSFTLNNGKEVTICDLSEEIQ